MDQNITRAWAFPSLVNLFYKSSGSSICSTYSAHFHFPTSLSHLSHGGHHRPPILERLSVQASHHPPPTPGSGAALPAVPFLRYQPRDLPGRKVVSCLSREYAQVRIRSSRQRAPAYRTFSDLPIVNDPRDLMLKDDGMALCVSKFSSHPSPEC